MDKHNTDTHQVQEGGAIGYSKEYLSGLSKVFNEGYIRFCNKKVDIYGRKCDRTHLLGGLGKIDCTNHDKKS
jgi:hypothetical protein|tara:strand:+ start:593 stop:808 length:216 start_codon:yes stop_codon:yes gene_type:complete